MIFATRLLMAMLVCSLSALLTIGCASGNHSFQQRPENSDTRSFTGVASWYGKPFHGRKTASGEVYDMYGLSAAHRSLPLGTRLQITNLDNQRQVVVRVNDRGPFVKGRILDLSYGAAKKLGYVSQGTARVRAVILSNGERGETIQSEQHETPCYAGSRLVIGEYDAQWKAERIRSFLQGRFRTIQIETSGKIYRVVIGPFKNERIRRQVLNRLRNEGYDVQAE